MVKDTIREALLATGRKGMPELLEEMEKNGFFTAPCSGQYHLCKEGGLAEHSLNVYKAIINIAGALKADVPMDSLVIVSLLHDMGKSGQFGKTNYVPNMIKSKTKNKETGEYDLVQSTAKPYETNKELIYEEHELRSVIIASKYIDLTEEEQHAIIHHNGSWCKLESSFSSTWDKQILTFILHFADLYCSRFVETKGEEEK